MIRLANEPVKLTVADWQRVREGLTGERGEVGNLNRVIDYADFRGRAWNSSVSSSWKRS